MNFSKAMTYKMEKIFELNVLNIAVEWAFIYFAWFPISQFKHVFWKLVLVFSYQICETWYDSTIRNHACLYCGSHVQWTCSDCQPWSFIVVHYPFNVKCIRAMIIRWQWGLFYSNDGILFVWRIWIGGIVRLFRLGKSFIANNKYFSC